MTIQAHATRPTLPWRRLGWGALAALLLVPAVAMRFTDEMRWDETDFIVMGVLLGAVGLAFELLARRARGAAYLAGSALAVAGCFLLVWINLAVGIIGSENDPANTMYAAVIAVVVGGGMLSRGRPGGMARAMFAAAAAQLAVAVVAFAGGLGVDGGNWPRDLIGATGLFLGLWLAAAALFARAARAVS